MMWFPSNVNKSPIFEIAQILHGITAFTGVLNITGSFMVMLGLIYHTSSHFRMLVDLIDDIGIRFSTKKLSDQRQCLSADQLYIEDTPIDADSELSQYLLRCIEYHQEIIKWVTIPQIKSCSYSNTTGKVRKNVTLKHIREIIFAVEKQ